MQLKPTRHLIKPIFPLVLHYAVYKYSFTNKWSLLTFAWRVGKHTYGALSLILLYQ